MVAKEHVASFVVSAPPEAVYDLLVDEGRVAEVHPRVVSHDLASAPAPPGEFDTNVVMKRWGVRHKISGRTVELLRPVRMVHETAAPSMTGRIVTELAPEGTGTRVTFRQTTRYRWWVNPLNRWVAVHGWHREIQRLGDRVNELLEPGESTS